MPLPTLCVLRTEVLFSSRTTVVVYFSAAVNTTDATNAANYTIAGLTVSTAAVSAVVLKNVPGTIINLTISTTPVPGTTYSLQVSNIRNVGNTYTLLNVDGLKTFTPVATFNEPTKTDTTGGFRQPRIQQGAYQNLQIPAAPTASVVGGSNFNTGFN